MPNTAGIVVIGSRGQLGSELCRQYGRRAVGLDLPEFDLTDGEQVCRSLLELKPAVVINTAAYTRVDRAELGGAPLLGVNGICLISHGGSDARAICNAVRRAAEAVAHNVNDHIVAGLRACTTSRPQ